MCGVLIEFPSQLVEAVSVRLGVNLLLLTRAPAACYLRLSRLRSLNDLIRADILVGAFGATILNS